MRNENIAKIPSGIASFELRSIYGFGPLSLYK
jgi:hypothetical protein